MTTGAARRAVFDTPELLENIISSLSHVDILKVQRLTRQWQNTVGSSPSIQSKLWLRPQNLTAVQPVDFTHESTFPRSQSWGRLTMPIYSRDVLFNPICLDEKKGPVQLEIALKPSFLFRTASGSVLHPTVIECFLPNTQSTLYDESIDAPRSSWRDMYLTDPPITTCVLQLDNRGRFVGDSPRTVPMAVQDHGGLKLGLVYDTILAGLRSNVRKEFAHGNVLSGRVAILYTVFE